MYGREKSPKSSANGILHDFHRKFQNKEFGVHQIHKKHALKFLGKTSHFLPAMDILSSK